VTVRVRRAYADGPFGQIHYRIARPDGPTTKPPLLCLHQTPKSGRDYERLIECLGEQRVCIAADTPGYGESDPPPAPSIEIYAHSIFELVETLRAAGVMPAVPFDLMGYHTGGVIGACMAREHPERVRRLVFVSLPALDTEARRKRIANMDRFPVPRDDASNIQELWVLTETLNDHRLDTEWRHKALAECLRTGSKMPWGFRAVYMHDCMADLRALDQPALILCPRDDLWDETHEHADLLPKGRLVEFAQAANGFLDLDTDDVASLITSFLEEEVA